MFVVFDTKRKADHKIDPAALRVHDADRDVNGPAAPERRRRRPTFEITLVCSVALSIPGPSRTGEEERPQCAEETANCPSTEEKRKNKIDATGKRHKASQAQS